MRPHAREGLCVGACVFWPLVTRRQTERLAERRAAGGADVVLKHFHFL